MPVPILLLLLLAGAVDARQRVVTVCLDDDQRFFTLESNTVASCANPIATAKLGNKINETGSDLPFFSVSFLFYLDQRPQTP